MEAGDRVLSLDSRFFTVCESARYFAVTESSESNRSSSAAAKVSECQCQNNFSKLWVPEGTKWRGERDANWVLSFRLLLAELLMCGNIQSIEHVVMIVRTRGRYTSARKIFSAISQDRRRRELARSKWTIDLMCVHFYLQTWSASWRTLYYLKGSVGWLHQPADWHGPERVRASSTGMHTRRYDETSRWRDALNKVFQLLSVQRPVPVTAEKRTFFHYFLLVATWAVLLQ
jgi:hypothetical protein